jgi:hypothetical protein
MIHHFFALITLLSIAITPGTWWMWPYGLVIEGQTFLIVLQRKVQNKNLRLAVRALMAITWVPMRIIPSLYPITFLIPLTLNGTIHWALGLIGVLEGLAIFGMQVVWTYALMKGFWRWYSGQPDELDAAKSEARAD